MRIGNGKNVMFVSGEHSENNAMSSQLSPRDIHNNYQPSEEGSGRGN